MELSVTLRLLIAALLGGIIGLQRERAERPAGLRTHVLVCVGATLVMIVSAYAFRSDSRADPARIAAQVMVGIGFIGAGTIIRQGSVIRGITTAASIWIVAAVGLAVGIGFYVPAVVTTLVAYAVLVALKLIEERFISRRQEYNLKVELDESSADISEVEHELELLGAKPSHLSIRKQENIVSLEAVVVCKKTSPAQMLKTIGSIKGVRSLFLE